MTKVKMCGIRRAEDIGFVNEVMPDYIGYVFVQKSKRYIAPEQALALTELLDERIIPVGVFVDEPVENVIAAVKSGAVMMAQLHGSEPDEDIARLHSECIEVIKAFIVKSESDIERANLSPADYVLLDAGMGDGKQFDYELLEGMKRPYFLAGGLSAENAAEAAEQLMPFAVDVSSGIETDGFKDITKMRAFMQTLGR